jgi:hypothetical protein
MRASLGGAFALLTPESSSGAWGKHIDKRIVSVISICVAPEAQVPIHIRLRWKSRQDRACVAEDPDGLHTCQGALTSEKRKERILTHDHMLQHMTVHHPCANILFGDPDTPCPPPCGSLWYARCRVAIEHSGIPPCRGIVPETYLIGSGIIRPIPTKHQVSNGLLPGK